MNDRGRALATAVLCAVLWLAVTPAALAERSPEELKARFLYQLLKYVSWSDASLVASEGAFIIGIVGDEALAAVLAEATAAKRVHGLPIVVERIQSLDTSPRVHVLYFSDSKRSALRERARPLADTPVLTVAENFDFPKYGGDIGIEIVDGRVSFSINKQKTGGGGVSISSKFLRLASSVR